MKKNSIFDKKYIEGLANFSNEKFANDIHEKVIILVGNAIEVLASKIPFITPENVILQPFNETFNNAFTPMSKFQYFLGINSPQMELNCLNKINDFIKFKNRVVDAWKTSRKSRKKRLFKRKKKDIENEFNVQKYTSFEPEKYNLDNFRRDLQLSLAENLSVTSIVYNTSDRVIIQGKDDFGSITQIEIIPVIYNDDIYKYFVNRKKGFVEYNMNDRLLNLKIKEEISGENFTTMLRVFNNLFKSITKDSINQIFLESILYNVPSEIYLDDDIYQVFINIINYFINTDAAQFVSIENTKEKLFESDVTKDSLGVYIKFLKKIR